MPLVSYSKMTLVSHSNLSKDLSSILKEANDFNVIIKSGEEPNSKEFSAHSAILIARSPYFKTALSSEWVIKKDGVIMFDKPNIIPEVFEIILKYIYNGELDLTNHQGERILDLLVASDELLLEEVLGFTQNCLIEEHLNWIKENIRVINTTFKLAKCQKLQSHLLKSISVEAQSFIGSKDFPLLDKDILYEFLKRDDLRIEEELEVWNCLIKWGIEQIPELEGDRNKWNNENYEELKETLNKFIPLIRFTEISRNDYFDKIRPYKAILPNNIYEEIEEFYFKGTKPKITNSLARTEIIKKIKSNIINPKLSNIIISWIEDIHPCNTREWGGWSNETSNSFDLIYRMSRDGIGVMRDRCVEPVLILVKVRSSDKIFGGYNPIGWKSRHEEPNPHPYSYSYRNRRGRGNHRGFITDGRDRHESHDHSETSNNPTSFYSETKKSFIFSFENKKDINNRKISRVSNHSNAIFNNADKNEINFGGNDLKLKDDILTLSNGNDGNYEDNLKSNGSYVVEEIEAFKVLVCYGSSNRTNRIRLHYTPPHDW